MDFYITIQLYVPDFSSPEIRVLFEFVNFRESLRMMENGPSDESSEERTLVTLSSLKIMGYMHLRPTRLTNFSLSMMKVNRKKFLKVDPNLKSHRQ